VSRLKEVAQYAGLRPVASPKAELSPNTELNALAQASTPAPDGNFRRTLRPPKAENTRKAAWRKEPPPAASRPDRKPGRKRLLRGRADR
jgi:hypothetical protein